VDLLPPGICDLVVFPRRVKTNTIDGAHVVRRHRAAPEQQSVLIRTGVGSSIDGNLR
jgi:hypothetical protein